MTWRRALRSLAVAIGLAQAPPASADTYGLVVGIDAYVHLPRLAGAVNDASDIADALRAAGARKVVTLMDGAATRAAILAAWSDLTGLARPGDTVVFTYAGHGGQEPERIAGNEPDDHLDETFQLAGFSFTAPGNGERIIDDEINALFRAAGHLNVVFIADSCHSGTMTRSFDRRAGVLRTRLGGYGPIVDDTLPAPQAGEPGVTVDQLRNVVYFGAVQDHELALEFTIEGKPRGALSWSFARALRGYADRNRDGYVDTRELEKYLIENVRTRSEGRQLPQMTPRGSPVEIALRVGTADQPQTGALRIAVLGDFAPADLSARLRNVALDTASRAELIWDTASGEVISSGGDIVARLDRGPDFQGFQAIVDKWLLLADLRNLAETKPLQLRLTPDDGLYRNGARATFHLSGHDYPFLTLFNVAADGRLQFIAPWPQSPQPVYRGLITPGQPLVFPLEVGPPFGVDHLVAIASETPADALNEALLHYDGKNAASQLSVLIPKLLGGATYQLGYIGLYTAP